MDTSLPRTSTSGRLSRKDKYREAARTKPQGEMSHVSPLTDVPFFLLQQVKTVRFQNYSPPPTKHNTFQPTSGKPDQPATPKGPQPEAAAPLGPEMTILFAHRSGCHSGQQTELRRKSAFGKTPVSTASATQTTFPSK